MKICKVDSSLLNKPKCALKESQAKLESSCQKPVFYIKVSPMREGVVSESGGHYVAVILGGILVFVILLVAVLGLAFWR